MRNLLLLLLLLSISGIVHAQTFRWAKTGQSFTPPSTWGYRTNGVACANGLVGATGYFSEDLTLDNSTFTSFAGRYPNAFTGIWGSNGVKQWLQPSFGTIPPTQSSAAFLGTAVGLDATGNSYVAYLISNDVLLDTVYVSVPATTGYFACAVLAKYTPTGRVVWVRKLVGGERVEIRSVAVTPAGTVVVGGNFTGSLTIGSQTLTARSSVYYHNEAFLASYDAAGTPLWARHLPTLSTSMFYTAGITGVAFDNAGNVLVAGGFSGAIALDGQTSFTDIIDPQVVFGGARDAFLAKYTAQSSLLWGRQLGGPAYDYAQGVAADGSGNVFVTGTFGYTGNNSAPNIPATFTSTPGTPAVTLTDYGPRGNGDVFVARYNAQGTLSWVRPIWGLGREAAWAVATSNQGAVYVGGSVTGGTSFDAVTVLPGSGAASEAYVAKYDATGALRWVKGYGGSDSNAEAGVALASDGAGHLYVGGAFRGNATFGTFYAASTNPTVMYPYLAALDDNETVLSSRNSATSNNQLSAYPNPSTGRVQLNWPPNLYPSRLEVRDIVGRLLRTEAIGTTATAHALQLADLPRGVYLLQLLTSNQQLTRRIVLE